MLIPLFPSVSPCGCANRSGSLECPKGLEPVEESEFHNDDDEIEGVGEVEIRAFTSTPRLDPEASIIVTLSFSFGIMVEETLEVGAGVKSEVPKGKSPYSESGHRVAVFACEDSGRRNGGREGS